MIRKLALETWTTLRVDIETRATVFACATAMIGFDMFKGQNAGPSDRRSYRAGGCRKGPASCWPLRF
jgi:hypothetical protein